MTKTLTPLLVFDYRIRNLLQPHAFGQMYRVDHNWKVFRYGRHIEDGCFALKLPLEWGKVDALILQISLHIIEGAEIFLDAIDGPHTQAAAEAFRKRNGYDPDRAALLREDLRTAAGWTAAALNRRVRDYGHVLDIVDEFAESVVLAGRDLGEDRFRLPPPYQPGRKTEGA